MITADWIKLFVLSVILGGCALCKAQSLYEREVSTTELELATNQPGIAKSLVNPIASPPPEPRSFQKHDIVHIVISESTRVKNKHDVKMEKDSDISAAITDFPELLDFLELRFKAGNNSSSELPKVGGKASKQFQSKGNVDQNNTLTARIAATVLEVKPNGTLLLEARQTIETDGESQTLVLSGLCREEDVTAANTVLSYQLADLRIRRETEGDLKDNAEKGFFTRVFDTIFAF